MPRSVVKASLLRLFQALLFSSAESAPSRWEERSHSSIIGRYAFVVDPTLAEWLIYNRGKCSVLAVESSFVSLTSSGARDGNHDDDLRGSFC